MAIHQAAFKMKAVIDEGKFNFDNVYYSKLMLDDVKHFSDSLTELSKLSIVDAKTKKVSDKTMVELLRGKYSPYQDF